MIKAKSGISNARLFWTTDTLAGYTQVNMTQSIDTFTASIPAKPLNTKVYYYISATSNSSRTVTKPITAPSGNFRFLVTNATSSETGNEIVREYKLYQNYPNPFNPVTSINFSMPEAEFVSIKVFDLLGREVKTLVNEKRVAGMHNVYFDASGLGGGVYFCRISAGKFSDVKKMILIK
jgi:hypothetical protein